MLVAQARGVVFRQEPDGYWCFGTPFIIVEKTYDDVMKWLGFQDIREYLTMLETEGPAIFDRATD